jgi:hypothetical protein
MGAIDHEKRLEAEKKASDLVKTMNGLSDEGFLNRMRNDPFFRSGVMIIINIIEERRPL